VTFRPPVATVLQLAGSAGPIEALLEEPANAGPVTAFGVVCHPHPLFGGSLTNKVVHTLARVWQELGVPTLRFNFRGVGGSAGSFDEGRGETTDALQVIEWGRQRWPGATAWIAGFSFGSFVALRAAQSAAPGLLITVAPPVGRWDFSGLVAPSAPWLIVQGDRDELVDVEAVQSFVRSFEPRPPQLTVMAGAEHFFHGRLHELRDIVRQFSEAGARSARSS
jgi:alpha/beta superfamily hydrolase